jgi:hypothetical protein
MKCRGAERQMTVCTHGERILVTDLPTAIAGCEDCLDIGGDWVHLRMCLTCGRIGCCDSSPNKHASRHAGAAAHPVACSAEPGEEWCWCYVDEVAFFVQPRGAAVETVPGTETVRPPRG